MSESAPGSRALPAAALPVAPALWRGDRGGRGGGRRSGGRAVAGALLGMLVLAAGPLQAAPGRVTAVTGQTRPEAMPEPMRIAMLLAKAAGGGVGFVGAALALDDSATAAEVAIIQPVAIEKMKTGEILLLAKDDCTTPTGCLTARRIVEKRGADVATKRYGRPAPTRRRKWTHRSSAVWPTPST
jgi:hypothetical protein